MLRSRTIGFNSQDHELLGLTSWVQTAKAETLAVGAVHKILGVGAGW